MQISHNEKNVKISHGVTPIIEILRFFSTCEIWNFYTLIPTKLNVIKTMQQTVLLCNKLFCRLIKISCNTAKLSCHMTKLSCLTTKIYFRMTNILFCPAAKLSLPCDKHFCRTTIPCQMIKIFFCMKITLYRPYRLK